MELKAGLLGLYWKRRQATLAACSAAVYESLLAMAEKGYHGHCLAVSRDRAKSLYDRLVALWEPEQAVLCVGGISWSDGQLVPQDTSPIALLAKSAG